MNKKISSISTPYVCAGKKLCAPIRGRAGKILLAAARFKESADVKSRIGILKAVRNVKREALTLFWLYESEASFDGVCNQLKVFTAHNISSLSRVHLNNKNGFSMVKVFLVKHHDFVRESEDSHQTVGKIQSHFNTLCVCEQKIMRPVYTGARAKNYESLKGYVGPTRQNCCAFDRDLKTVARFCLTHHVALVKSPKCLVF